MINRFFQQLRMVWTDLSMSARIGLVITAVVCIAVIVGVGYWSAQPHYVPLVNNLDPAKASEIVAVLDSQSIANKLNYSGSAVLVDQSKWNKAQIAISEIVDPGQIESTDIGSPFSDPTTAQYKMRIQLEQRLARTIMQIASVEQATVHLGIADNEPFIRDRKPTTASVLVKLRSGTPFTNHQAQSIVAVVSNSVQGLQPQDVTVVDTKGNVLSGDGSTVSSLISGQLDYRRQVENELAQKAETMLTAALGYGRAIVRVTADIDFNQQIRETRTLDPERKAKAKETIESTTASQSRPPAMGAAGVDSNLEAGLTGNSKNVLSKTEKTDVTYENGWVNESVTDVPGTIRRLTIAAMVQLTPPAADGADPNAAPAAPTITKETVEQIVKQAVGFDPRRNDVIEVLDTNLAIQNEFATLMAPPPESNQFISDLVRNLSLGIGAVVAFVLGFLVIKRIQPVSVPEPESTEWTPQRARQISDLASVIRENPELLSKVISAWAGEKSGRGGDNNQRDKRRAA